MSQELKNRTKRFALDCWHLSAKIPKSREFDSYVRQLLRSSSSVAANYRAALRGKSGRDFLNKLRIVEEEADESVFWLELFKEIESKNQKEIIRLLNEGEELLKIVVASINTTKKRMNI
ncbi:four helix bundle protein [Flagellimonas sp.]|uniref:four helix bundle protein n=1 Tax=Flagellimonas sp. TaxID=2058762 RepID=UPI003B510533